MQILSNRRIAGLMCHQKKILKTLFKVTILMDVLIRNRVLLTTCQLLQPIIYFSNFLNIDDTAFGIEIGFLNEAHDIER